MYTGTLNEYNNSQSREDKEDKWHEDVLQNEYKKQYKDLKNWKK